MSAWHQPGHADQLRAYLYSCPASRQTCGREPVTTWGATVRPLPARGTEEHVPRDRAKRF